MCLDMTFIINKTFYCFLLERCLRLGRSVLGCVAVNTKLNLVSDALKFFVLVNDFTGANVANVISPACVGVLIGAPAKCVCILHSVDFTLLLLLVIIGLGEGGNRFSVVRDSVFYILLLPVVFDFSRLKRITGLALLTRVLLSVRVLIVSL